MTTAAERWRDQLDSWAIPPQILAAAPESPWGFPPELFRTRAQGSDARDELPTTSRAMEVLADDGSVLDVGVGGGATSLPLAGRASTITGVDAQQDMLEVFEASAANAGVKAATVLGKWPDVSSRTPAADVVVCGHVVYNVADLGPFVRALDGHASRRVVIELTERHPLSWMNDLWLRFHGLTRPDGPTATDAAAVVRETIGSEPALESFAVPGEGFGGGFAHREDAIAMTRRRLCISPELDDELVTALGDRLIERDGLWSYGPGKGTLMTLWWDVRA